MAKHIRAFRYLIAGLEVLREQDIAPTMKDPYGQEYYIVRTNHETLYDLMTEWSFTPVSCTALREADIPRGAYGVIAGALIVADDSLTEYGDYRLYDDRLRDLRPRKGVYA